VLRQALPPASALEQAALAAKALADPTRLRVALALRDGGELCVCDLAWIAERPDKLVSHQRLADELGSAATKGEGRQNMLCAYSPQRCSSACSRMRPSAPGGSTRP